MIIWLALLLIELRKVSAVGCKHEFLLLFTTGCARVGAALNYTSCTIAATRAALGLH